jgi:hypothetical protein
MRASPFDSRQEFVELMVIVLLFQIGWNMIPVSCSVDDDWDPPDNIGDRGCDYSRCYWDGG